MIFQNIILLLPFIGAAFAGDPEVHKVHGSRPYVPPAWKELEAGLNLSSIVEFRVALVQSNLHLAHEALMNVSDPASPHYSQHWTAKQIAEFFAPSDESIEATKSWLLSSGIDPNYISLSRSKGFLKFKTSIAHAEELFHTKYALYEHVEDPATLQLATLQYSLPANITAHVDFVHPTLHFRSIPTRKPGSKTKARERRTRRDPMHARRKNSKHSHHTKAKKEKSSPSPVEAPQKQQTGTDGQNGGSSPKDPASPPTSSSEQDSTTNCANDITPACLRALYNIPKNQGTKVDTSMAVVSYDSAVFDQRSLDTFFAKWTDIPAGSAPVFLGADGAHQITDRSELHGVTSFEPDMDLMYAWALTYPQKMNYYQIGDQVKGHFTSFSSLLDAIDGEFCATDDDGSYPDAKPGGYNKARECGTLPRVSVISESWTSSEIYGDQSYLERQCHEYLKLGLMGTTFLFGSGDHGVASDRNTCINSDGSNGNEGRFSPPFPSSCPYVTGVGGTQIQDGNTVRDAEVAWNSGDGWTPGGGFSNAFNIPDFQSEAIRKYWAANPPPYDAAKFNTSMKSRGIPDISANAGNHAVGTADGSMTSFSGTSLATPTVGAIISLLNQARAEVGKKPMGFINPFLYANADLMNDITDGSNPGCDTSGFRAVAGWDPITGLGTIDYAKLLPKALALP